LFEMLTSQRAFPGEDITDTIVAIVSREPDWVSLPVATPPGLRRLLTRCLKKDPKARMRDVGEARLQIEELISGTVEEIPAAIASRPVAPQPRWRRSIPVAAAAVVSGAIVGSAAWALRPSPPPAPVARFAIALGEGQQFGTTNFPSIGISRDGTRLVYVANRQ